MTEYHYQYSIDLRQLHDGARARVSNNNNLNAPTPGLVAFTQSTVAVACIAFGTSVNSIVVVAFSCKGSSKSKPQYLENDSRLDSVTIAASRDRH